MHHQHKVWLGLNAVTLLHRAVLRHTVFECFLPFGAPLVQRDLHQRCQAVAQCGCQFVGVEKSYFPLDQTGTPAAA